jgi:predicted methyltransferase
MMFQDVRRFAAGLFVVLALVGAGGCASIDSAPAPDYAAIIAAPDRTDADRQNDVRRKQPQLLAFTNIRPGMRVLDMGAGGGYTTELLARTVGVRGVVYAQDSKAVIESTVKDRFDQRAKKPVMGNVVRVVRDYDDPLPAGVCGLDAITFFFAYHDVSYMAVDRARMNRRMFDALKPGGHLIIADHSARAGDGVSVSKTLHRIEESVLRREIEAAGFRLVGEGAFLRNPADPRSAPVFRLPVPVDEFVLDYVRP